MGKTMQGNASPKVQSSKGISEAARIVVDLRSDTVTKPLG